MHVQAVLSQEPSEPHIVITCPLVAKLVNGLHSLFGKLSGHAPTIVCVQGAIVQFALRHDNISNHARLTMFRHLAQLKLQIWNMHVQVIVEVAQVVLLPASQKILDDVQGFVPLRLHSWNLPASVVVVVIEPAYVRHRFHADVWKDILQPMSQIHILVVGEQNNTTRRPLSPSADNVGCPLNEFRLTGRLDCVKHTGATDPVVTIQGTRRSLRR
mmetsp:Transcript_43075/g.112092  ORF Transcript_43075/g.112092 Transcript_43075/m.112092 type:complete len:214 (-) Transcript_43075:81-722(-)